jgi:hypothetical protein
MFVTRPNKVPYKRPAPVGLFGAAPGMVPMKEQDLFFLDAPLVWDDGKVRLTAPAGMISDDASIPKILDAIPFLDRQGDSRLPGLMHDAGYNLGREKGKDWWDLMLRQFCLAEGMSAFGAGCIYQGVRLFGASSWANDADVGKVGVIGGDFISQEYHDAWIKAGATIFQ